MFLFYNPEKIRRKNYYCNKVRENHKPVENVRDAPDKRKFCERTQNCAKTEENPV